MQVLEGHTIGLVTCMDLACLLAIFFFNQKHAQIFVLNASDSGEHSDAAMQGWRGNQWVLDPLLHVFCSLCK